ncbi:MAG TPA: creatininase family protein [Methylomirabilota bacterium]|nr:creatininase family protein [Methylomirabilota bacterium]
MMSIYKLEELSTTALDQMDRERTVVILTVSPLEEHGPHLPLGVDALTAQYFAQGLADRIVRERAGWQVVLAPTLYLGSFTFDHVGTMKVRQRVVRDLLVDYGTSFARAGFHYLLISNGHAGPGHLVALEEAARTVSRRYGIRMGSLTGHLAWRFLTGKYLEQIESRLGRPLSPEEREAFREDAHGGWWETSMMLLLRPDLVDPVYRELPPSSYGWLDRLRPNYPLKNGGQGYVGHPALADPEFARASGQVLLDAGMELVNKLLDGRLRSTEQHSPFFRLVIFRTNFWRAVAGVLVLAATAALYWVLR